MGHKRGKPAPQSKSRTTFWLVLGAAGLLGIGVVGGWAVSGRFQDSRGTPRLEVDRTQVELGYRRFDTVAPVVFTLTNTGTGLLRLKEVPPVKVVKGC